MAYCMAFFARVKLRQPLMGSLTGFSIPLLLLGCFWRRYVPCPDRRRWSGRGGPPQTIHVRIGLCMNAPPCGAHSSVGCDLAPILEADTDREAADLRPIPDIQDQEIEVADLEPFPDIQGQDIEPAYSEPFLDVQGQYRRGGCRSSPRTRRWCGTMTSPGAVAFVRDW